jgi:hypothetical protein
VSREILRRAFLGVQSAGAGAATGVAILGCRLIEVNWKLRANHEFPAENLQACKILQFLRNRMARTSRTTKKARSTGSGLLLVSAS